MPALDEYSCPSLYAKDRDQKICSHIMNMHIKRLRMTVKKKIGTRKMTNSQSYLSKIADKKNAYDEG